MRIRLRGLLAPIMMSFAIPLATSAIPLSPGDLVVSGSSDVGSGLIRVDPTTGDQTLISAGNFGDFSLVGDTAYALSSSSVTAIDLDTGAQATVSSGGLLDSLHGLTVGSDGTIFAYSQDINGTGSIIAIDPGSGGQSLLSTGNLSGGPRDYVDLELSKDGNVLVLNHDESYGTLLVEELLEISVLDGSQTQPYSNDLGGLCGGCASGLTGMAVGPGGDIFMATGGWQGTGVIQVDAAGGPASAVGSTVPTGFGQFGTELLNADMAFDSSGNGWIIGFSQGGNVASANGVWRWDGNTLYEDPSTGKTAFSLGDFNEIQVVAIPEPGTALLMGLGLAGLAGVRKRAVA